MKKMLINATQQEELRVALVDGQRLYDLDIETLHSAQKKSNIYKGKITNIEPSLEAVFVDYGAQRHGFLPFKEIAKEYLIGSTMADEHQSIKDMLRVGQQVLVQIEKEERGNKGAALTTYVSLAGRFLVLMPNNPRAGGVSRRIQGEERQELRDVLEQLVIPEESGIIVRTAGLGRSAEELQWDLDFLFQVWQAISDEYQRSEPQRLIYQDNNIVVRALRDYLRADIHKILIDDERVYQQAKSFMELVMPNNLNKLERYQNNVPLFSRYQIEGQIESAYQRTVQLPSGGELVIDYTEALTSIDINSSKATKGGDIEETAYQTNLEAADEIARQMRLRDLGGLIVIDFIDMSSSRNRKEVEHRLLKATEIDRARVQIGRISRFGLLELSRQRLRPSVDELSHHTCHHCRGQGSVRSVQSMALSLLRIIEEEALKEKTVRITGELPIQVATYLLNEKRAALRQIEQRNKVEVLLVPNPNMHTPNYHISRLREDEVAEQALPSYRMPLSISQEEEIVKERPAQEALERAAVQDVMPSKPAPETQQAQKSALAGSFSKVVAFFKQDRRELDAWLKAQPEALPEAEKEENKQERPPRRKHHKEVLKPKAAPVKQEAEEALPQLSERQEKRPPRPEKHNHEAITKEPEALVLPKELQAAAARDAVNPSLDELLNPPSERKGRTVRKGRPRDIHAVRGQGKADYMPTVSAEAAEPSVQPEKRQQQTTQAPAVVSFLRDAPEEKKEARPHKHARKRQRRGEQQALSAEQQWQNIVARVEEAIAAIVPPVASSEALPARSKNNKIQALNDLGQQFCLDQFSVQTLLDASQQALLSEAACLRLNLADTLPWAALQPERPLFEALLELAVRAWQVHDQASVLLDVPLVFAPEAEALIQQIKDLHDVLRDARFVYPLPSSDAGVAALEALTAAGIRTHLSSMFHGERLLQAQHAYARGIAKRLAAQESVSELQVSFGFSLNIVDEEMDARLRPEHQQYKGLSAISLAKSAYQSWQEEFNTAAWQALEAQGAKRPTLIWLGTETLNPHYAKVRYVDHLIGAQTASAMNAATYHAFMEQGHVRPSVAHNVEAAQKTVAELQAVYDLKALAKRLEAYSQRQRYLWCLQWQHGQQTLA